MLYMFMVEHGKYLDFELCSIWQVFDYLLVLIISSGAVSFFVHCCERVFVY